MGRDTRVHENMVARRDNVELSRRLNLECCLWCAAKNLPDKWSWIWSWSCLTHWWLVNHLDNFFCFLCFCTPSSIVYLVIFWLWYFGCLELLSYCFSSCRRWPVAGVA